MNNIYYRLWLGAIYNFKKRYPKDHHWRMTVLIIFSLLNALNLWLIFSWLEHFKVPFIHSFCFNTLFGIELNGFWALIIEYALPLVVLNYLLIFHHNRYDKLIVKYKDYQSKYAYLYSFTVLLFAMITIIVL